MISVENLSLDYAGVPALADLSFELPRGGVTVLTGPNGSGKSSLLRVLATLTPPGSGEVRIDGVDGVKQPGEARTRIGYLADDYGLYERLTVRRCLWFAGAMRGFSGGALSLRIDQLAAQWELESFLDLRAGELSKGYRQRLGAAQAMVHRPTVLLLDEPGSGLDVDARSRLLEGLARTCRAEEVTLVAATHHPDEWGEWVDHRLILDQGGLAALERVTEGEEIPE